MAPHAAPRAGLQLLLERQILSQIEESQRVLGALATHRDLLLAIANLLAATLDQGGTLYLCGNGGSAADAQHVAAEFVGRFLRQRRPLPAVALTVDSSILTSIANDYDFSEVFSRQVQALVGPQDCLIGISTSGRSPNVLKALVAAREAGAATIGFTGADRHEFAALCDQCLQAPSRETARIQEAHLLAWHLICNIVDQYFTPSAADPHAG